MGIMSGASADSHRAGLAGRAAWPASSSTAANTAANTSTAANPAANAMAVTAANAADSRRIEGRGTPEAAWQAWGGLDDLPPVSAATLVPPGRRAVVIAPHPDDEVLACGGLLQLLAAQGTRTVLVAVTDGDASHPGSTVLPPDRLARLRVAETDAALATLGLTRTPAPAAARVAPAALAAPASPATPVRTPPSAAAPAGKTAAATTTTTAAAAPPPHLLRARLPDGAVAAHLAQLQTLLEQLLRPGDVVFTTWRRDGHPDHEACGLAAALATRATRAALVEMPVWSWHWAAPGDQRLPWTRARRLALPPEVLERKRQAVACYQSQLQPDASNGQPPVLPPHVLERLLRPFEIFFT